MAGFVNNVNAYLSHMKIKQTFLSVKAGIEKNKLSRILTGVQDINSTDMEKIADALGKRTEYFMSDDFSLPEMPQATATEVVFYAGEPDREQEEFAAELIELALNADEVLSAKMRFMMAVGE